MSRLSNFALMFSTFMQYKIELRFLGGWGDAEWTEERDGATEHMRFRTESHAQTAIDEFLDDVKEAVTAGNMDTEEISSHYRIVAVNS